MVHPHAPLPGHHLSAGLVIRRLSISLLARRGFVSLCFLCCQAFNWGGCEGKDLNYEAMDAEHRKLIYITCLCAFIYLDL